MTCDSNSYLIVWWRWWSYLLVRWWWWQWGLQLNFSFLLFTRKPTARFGPNWLLVWWPQVASCCQTCLLWWYQRYHTAIVLDKIFIKNGQRWLKKGLFSDPISVRIFSAPISIRIFSASCKISLWRVYSFAQDANKLCYGANTYTKKLKGGFVGIRLIVPL